MWGEFYDAVARLLYASNLSQRAIARAVGVSGTYVTRLKNSRDIKPADDKIVLLEAVLNARPGSLLRLARAARQAESRLDDRSSSGDLSAKTLDNDFYTPIVIEKLDCTYYLDGEYPVSDEVRYVRALEHGVTRLPHGLAVALLDDGSVPIIETAAREGVRISSQRNLVDRYINVYQVFAEPIPMDHTHRYRMVKTARTPLKPHYLLTPSAQVNAFELRIQFHPDNLPTLVQRVDREAEEVAESIRDGREKLRPDSFGLVEVGAFTRLENGYSYGAVWLE